MKREKLKKKMYVTPYMELHHAALDGYLMETSFPNNGCLLYTSDAADE